MNNEELLQFEDIQYVDPRLSESEQMSFVNTLRDIQAQNNAQINQQTRALGSDVPVYQGGLTGSEGVFQARYQTPQMAATVANLQNTARQTALNTALANQETMWKNRYTQAQRALQDAQHNYSTTPSSTGGGGNGGLDFEGQDEITNVSSEWEGPASTTQGTTTVAEDENTQWTTSNESGNVLNPDWNFASIAVKQIQQAGGTVLNVENVGKMGLTSSSSTMARITYRDQNGKIRTKYFQANDAYPAYMQ